MRPQKLSHDSLAILLLCSRIGLGRGRGGPRTLGPVEWHKLAMRIHVSELGSPGALLGLGPREIERGLGLDPAGAGRLHQLLARSGPATLELEHWLQRGLWVLTRADAGYPRRWKERLRRHCPPVVFGAGPVEALSRPGIAVVGSRRPSPEQLDNSLELGREAARQGFALYSGGARGVDRAAMRGALEAGGTTVGILADSLEKLLSQRDNRAPIQEGRLTLVTAQLPTAPFSVGAAMARNKYIHALADLSFVMSIQEPEGGSWSGAKECLENRWVPVFVEAATADSAGGQALRELGASLADMAAVRELEQLVGQEAPAPAPTPGTQTSLFGEAAPEYRPAPAEAPVATTPTDVLGCVRPVLLAALREPRPPKELAEELGVMSNQLRGWLKALKAEGLCEQVDSGWRRTAEAPAAGGSIFEAVWPLLEQQLQEPASREDLAEALEVQKGQVDLWLAEARRAGRVEKLGGEGAIYRLVGAG